MRCAKCDFDNIEGHAKSIENTKTHKMLVPVIPHTDGNWYCPDCGQYNLKKDVFCKGCGRDT